MDKDKNKEVEELSKEELEAAAELMDALADGIHYLRQELAEMAMWGHKTKYLN